MPVNQLHHFLFVVIPGAGGSVLQRTTSSGDRTTLWGDLPRLVRNVWEPDLLAIGDDDGIVATGVISDWALGPISLVRGYGGLVRNVANAVPRARIDLGDPEKPDPAARIVVFPYDFRRSVAESAEQLGRVVARRLKHLGWEDITRRVVVIAHSMGGLVARYWLGPLGGHRVCRGLVTLGTPHRGAPKALDVAANGFPLGPFRVARRLTDTLRTWPGFLELLPRYPMVADDGGVLTYPKDLRVTWLDEAMLQASWGVHHDIEKAWNDLDQDTAPAVVPVFGFGSDTPEVASLRSDGSLACSSVRPSSIGNSEWRGDKTVPNVSAVPLELDTLAGRLACRPLSGVKHGELPDWSGVRDILRWLCADVAPHVRGGGVRSMVVDAEEVWATKQPHRVVVRVKEHGGGSPSGAQDFGAAELVKPNDIAAVQFNIGDGWRSARQVDGEWAFDVGSDVTTQCNVKVRATTTDGNDPPEGAAVIQFVDVEAFDGS